MFNHYTFLRVLFIFKVLTGKRDRDIFPVETYLSFKMVYLKKNTKIYASNTQIVQQLSTKIIFVISLSMSTSISGIDITVKIVIFKIFTCSPVYRENNFKIKLLNKQNNITLLRIHISIKYVTGL